MGPKKTNKRTINLQLNPEDYQDLDKLIQRFGMPQREFVRRVFAWLLAQDPLVQAVVCGVVPQDKAVNVLDMVRRTLAGLPDPNDGAACG